MMGILSHALVGFFWLMTLRSRSHLIISANIFSVATGLAATLIGLFAYHEHLSFANSIGVGLGFVSIILLLS